MYSIRFLNEIVFHFIFKLSLMRIFFKIIILDSSKLNLFEVFLHFNLDIIPKLLFLFLLDFTLLLWSVMILVLLIQYLIILASHIHQKKIKLFLKINSLFYFFILSKEIIQIKNLKIQHV